jgi:hypothetical protein
MPWRERGKRERCVAGAVGVPTKKRWRLSMQADEAARRAASKKPLLRRVTPIDAIPPFGLGHPLFESNDPQLYRASAGST